MVFALVACIACCALTLVAAHLARGQHQVQEMTALASRLRPGGTWAGDSAESPLSRQVAEVFEAVESAATPEAAIAALNEFTFEVESNCPRGPEVPRGLGRACFSVGFLLGALAVADALGGAVGVDTARFGAALVAVAAGGVGGIFCYQIGQVASRRRRDYYDGAKRLMSALKARIPSRDP